MISQELPKCAQQDVSSVMTERVVEGLELVQIHHK
jgi:hypothetical protein